jgi:crossover junction endodeoxyribonuclease RusA
MVSNLIQQVGMTEHEEQVALRLPWPPSTNHTWGKTRDRRTGKPKVYLTVAARRFRADVARHVMAARAGKKIAGPVEVSVMLCPPDMRRRDEDNFAGKALFDALTHAGVWIDDSQIRRKTVEWGDVVKGGCVWVAVKELPA